jgi:phospholipase/lecithinase/hemolysin
MRSRGIALSEDLATRVSGYLGEYSEAEAYKPGTRYNVDLLDKYDLKQWAARQFLVTGTVDDIVARLQELIAAGARNIIVPQMYPDIMKTSRQAGEVFGALRSARGESG